MQPSISKSPGKAFLGLIGYVIGAVVAVSGISMVLAADPPTLRPVGLLLVVAGLLLMPPIGKRLGERWPKLSAWYAAPILGALVLTVGLATSLVIIADWEKDHPEIVAKRQAARMAQQAAALSAEKSKVRQEADLASKAAMAARKGRQQAFSAMWSQVTATMEPCEKSQGYLAKLLGQPGSLVQSYQMASQGRQICLQSYTGVGQITAPASLSEKASKLATEGLKGCASAMLARMTFFNIAGEVIDGDRRPSKLASAQAQNQAAGIATLQCIANLTEAAGADGLKLEKH